MLSLLQKCCSRNSTSILQLWMYGALELSFIQLYLEKYLRAFTKCIENGTINSMTLMWNKKRSSFHLFHQMGIHSSLIHLALTSIKMRLSRMNQMTLDTSLKMSLIASELRASQHCLKESRKERNDIRLKAFKNK